MCAVTGCGWKYSKKNAEKSGETIIEAIKTQDPELLKSILSEKALASEDLDEGIEYLFQIFDSEIISYEKRQWPEKQHHDNSLHKHSVMLTCRYKLITSSGEEYELTYCYNTVQDFDNTELGVNRIRAYWLKDTTPFPTTLSNYARAGVYSPAWDEE